MPRQPSWELPPVADAAEQGLNLTGGLRDMHELAVAIAATGRIVELRGCVDLDEVEALSESAGRWPELPRESRSPGPDDVVFVAEGYEDPLVFGQLALSGARTILMLLAPPGLFGWPFVESWMPQSPLEISIDGVARPEHFRAMASMGFELWTTLPALARRVERAGIPCPMIGVGRPCPYPAPQPKSYDVATFVNNRWTELARQVVSRLDPAIVHHEIPTASNDEILRQFGESRILVHPLRVEGYSRIGLEARAMGAVPVVLDSNPFSVGLDAEGGAVAVATLDEMPRAIENLLADPGRLEGLRTRAIRSAREQLDWDAYVARVDEALSRPRQDDPARQARAVMGGRFRASDWTHAQRVEAEIAHLHQQLSEVTPARNHLAQAEQHLAIAPDLELRVADLARELEDVRAADEAAGEAVRQLEERLTRSQRTYASVVSSPSWRLTKPLRGVRRLLRRG